MSKSAPKPPAPKGKPAMPMPFMPPAGKGPKKPKC